MKNVRTQEVTVMKVNKWEKGLVQPLATEVFSKNIFRICLYAVCTGYQRCGKLLSFGIFY